MRMLCIIAIAGFLKSSACGGVPFLSTSPQRQPLRQLTVTSPAQYQVYQRDGSTGDITITGIISGVTSSIEARFAGGAWSVIGTGIVGAFSLVLENQPQGSGTLEVKISGYTLSTVSIANVGVGDVFVIAGQSNAVGLGFNSQSYSGSPGASLFGNNYLWSNLADPTDSASDQVDTVSSDATAAGSVWPLIATSFLTDQAVPVAFIPCAKGAVSITAWLPSGGATNRNSLYGSMVWRAKYAAGTNGVKAVLWWQGETDAQASMSQATYFNHFTNLTANVMSDLGIKVMPCKLQRCSGIPDVREDAINAAFGQAWVSDSNTLTGPDLSGIDSDDAFHLQTDFKLQEAADLWWATIEAALYP